MLIILLALVNILYYKHKCLTKQKCCAILIIEVKKQNKNKMTKTKIITLLNVKIDRLIIAGETNSKEYKRLIKLHYKYTH